MDQKRETKDYLREDLDIKMERRSQKEQTKREEEGGGKRRKIVKDQDSNLAREGNWF